MLELEEETGTADAVSDDGWEAESVRVAPRASQKRLHLRSETTPEQRAGTSPAQTINQPTHDLIVIREFEEAATGTQPNDSASPSSKYSNLRWRPHLNSECFKDCSYGMRLLSD